MLWREIGDWYWAVHDAHVWGRLYCPQGDRTGCAFPSSPLLAFQKRTQKTSGELWMTANMGGNYDFRVSTDPESDRND